MNDPEDSVSENPEDTEKENHPMPLIKIDAIEGRSQSEVTTLLDAVHRAVVKAFHVPVQMWIPRHGGRDSGMMPAGIPK
jgi:hypothetical protein